MAQVRVHEPGGYRYIEGVSQYSAGVAAEPGFLVERARLRQPLPLAEGFAAVERHLAALGRPQDAFCACELRSPEPFTQAGFDAFNRDYRRVLEGWGVLDDGRTPVARTNVCPEHAPPAEPVLYAFSYTVPADSDHGGFIVAGSGETREGMGNYRDHIVRLGDTTPDGLREKIRDVVTTMESRLAALGFGWDDASATGVYTVHDIGPHLRNELVARGAAGNGIVWHFSRPPVVDIEFEMDVHGAVREIVL